MIINVTQIGMVTPVGSDTATACASMRADLRRLHALPGCFAPGDEEFQVPVMGHPVWGTTNGFYFLGRWVGLARGASRDALRRNPPSQDGRAEVTASFFVLPDPIADRFQFNEPVDPAAWKARITRHFTSALGLEPQRTAVTMGHTGALQALQSAQRVLARGDVQRAVVVAVDSYVDSCTLAWLRDNERLKSEAMPVGLEPGEAGVYLVLEPAERAKTAETRLLQIRRVALGHETVSPRAERAHGRALARVIRDALGDASAPFAGDLYTDLNGEMWRSHEWGSAWALVESAIDANSRVIAPAASVGEIGAASGAVSLGLAAHSYGRGYATGARALVVSADENGAVAAALVAG